jgi:hypothetical protein
MRSPRRLNLAQRIVTIIGLGIALGIFGLWVTTRGGISGWVGYAPLSTSAAYRSNLSVVFRGGLHPWVRLAIWLALTVVWTGASIALLRSASEP